MLPAPKPPLEHLLHRGEVVGGGREDLEAAIVGLLRRATLEHDHARDGVRAHQRRDVEALDPQRDRVEVERLLEAVERLDALLATALGAELLLVDRELRVALGELENPALVAALGNPDLDRPAAPV